MNTQSSNYPTTSDISSFMRELGYLWSNEAQTYYDHNFQFISDKSAKQLYMRLIGEKPFEKFIVNDVNINAGRLAPTPSKSVTD